MERIEGVVVQTIVSICSPSKEASNLLAKREDFEVLKAWKEVLWTTSEMLFHKQRVIKIVKEFVFEDWQSGRENKAVMCENNPFFLDLQNFQNLETDLCSMTARTF